jgi:hypothetical protein
MFEVALIERAFRTIYADPACGRMAPAFVRVYQEECEPALA